MNWKNYIIEKNKKFGKEIVNAYTPIVEETGQDMLFVNAITIGAVWFDGTNDIMPLRTTIYLEGACVKETNDPAECHEPLEYVMLREHAEEILGKFDVKILSRILRKKRRTEKKYYIMSEQDMWRVLEEIGAKQEYLDAVRQRRELKEKLKNKRNLMPVHFVEHQSWETGIKHYILRDRVDKKVFRILKERVHLFFHVPDEDNEERFRAWCFRPAYDDLIGSALTLAENGIELFVDNQSVLKNC